MALHLNTKGLVALYLFNNMKEKFLTSSFLATSFAQSINKLKSLIKKGIKYYLVSFVVVLTATAHLLQLWGDNQPVFMGPQFSTVFR